MALANIATKKEGRAKILEHNAIEKLFRFVNHPNDNLRHELFRLFSHLY